MALSKEERLAREKQADKEEKRIQAALPKVYEKAEQIDAIIKDIKADSRAGRINRKLFDKLQAALAATDKALGKVRTVVNGA